VKRRDLVRHIEANGCRFLREGGNHTIYFNPVNKKLSALPRHREVFDLLVVKICKDLGIPGP
jgi:predicted RNA binding protein YcfA (HicA-like mRNA interferase family)